MPRTFKGSETTMNLLVHTCVDKAPITELKIILFTTNPEVVFEINEGINVVGNIATFTVPNYAFGNMEDGVINYIVNGLMDDEAFITERQSNYYLKTPTNYTPSEGDDCPELIEITITENGVYEGAYDKVIVDVPQEGGDCPELEDITIEENGTYEGAFGKVVVDVPTSKVGSITITNNGTYTPQDETIKYLNFDGDDVFDLGIGFIEGDENTTMLSVDFKWTGDQTGEPINICGVENSDWDSESCFALRYWDGNFAAKIGSFEMNFPADNEWHNIELDYDNGVGRIIFDGDFQEGQLDNFTIPTGNFYVGATNTGGEIFRPFYGYISNVACGNGMGAVNFEPIDNGFRGNNGEEITNNIGGGFCPLEVEIIPNSAPIGYNLIRVNVDTEASKEEGRDEIRNKLQSINITANGRYSTDDMELIPYIEFDGNSYFDTTIPFGENTKIEVAITKTTYEEDEQVIGVAHYDLLATEEYGGFGIVLGNGYAYGAFGFAKTYDIGFSYGEEQILTLNKNGLSSNLYGRNGWIDESGLDASGLYGHTIGLGKIKSVSDGWSGDFNGLIRYVKIWTDGNDDSTMTLFRPKNMAQGGFGLINSEGVEYSYIENLGEGTATFKEEWVKKYGEGWKEINVNVIYEPFYGMTKTISALIDQTFQSAYSNFDLWVEDMTEYNNTHPDLTSNGMMFKIPDGTNPISTAYYHFNGIFGDENYHTIKPFGKTLVTPWVYNENNSPSTTIILPDYWIGGFDCTEVEYIDRVFEGAETIRAFTTLKNLGKSFTSVNTLDLSVLTNLNNNYCDGDCFEKIANSVYDFNVMNSNGISNSNVKLPSNVKQTAIDAWTAKGWSVEIVEAE